MTLPLLTDEVLAGHLTSMGLPAAALRVIRGAQKDRIANNMRKDLCAYLFRLGYSFTEIGISLSKDRTTIAHHCREVIDGRS